MMVHWFERTLAYKRKKGCMDMEKVQIYDYALLGTWTRFRVIFDNVK